MKYLVIEIQKTGNVMSNLAYAYDNRNEAEGKYHLILSSAAVSNVNVHAAVLLDEEGNFLESKCYKHESNNQ